MLTRYRRPLIMLLSETVNCRENQIFHQLLVGIILTDMRLHSGNHLKMICPLDSKFD